MGSFNRLHFIFRFLSKDDKQVNLKELLCRVLLEVVSNLFTSYITITLDLTTSLLFRPKLAF